MLKSRPEVSEVHCVKDAKVPLIRFKFDGIMVDLPYAQLRVLSVPNVSSQNFLRLNDFYIILFKNLIKNLTLSTSECRCA